MSKDNREDNLLKEYEVCQQAINSSSQNYWLITGIFIGVSSALLAGLMLGVLSNDGLFNAITGKTTEDLQILRIVTTFLGVPVIIIIIMLFLWLQRVNYLSDRTYERMREIELEYGMWKHWIILTIDKWKDKYIENLDDKAKEAIWSKLKVKLIKGLSKEYVTKLEGKKEELMERCNLIIKNSPQRCYHRPSRTYIYKVIIFTLVSVWSALILYVWLIGII